MGRGRGCGWVGAWVWVGRGVGEGECAGAPGVVRTAKEEEGCAQVEEFVVVDVKDPVDGALPALGNGAFDLPLLTLHQGVVVVRRVRIIRIERIVGACDVTAV